MPGRYHPFLVRSFALVAFVACLSGARLSADDFSFLNPSHSLPQSARASRGIAEHPTSRKQSEPVSPSDRPASVPNKHPTEGQEQHTPHHESERETAKAETEAAEGEEAEEEELQETLFATPLHKIYGVEWSVLYTGEVFNNMRGGISTNGATRYRGNTDIVFTYDTEANELWDGGQFFVYGSNTHGQTLSSDFVGDWQLYSNIDSAPRPNLMQVSEYWYLHTIDDGLFSIKLGKCDANSDFAYMQLASDYVHSSFSLSPNIALPTWPNQALGVVGFWKPRERLQFSAGVYDGGSDGRLWGFTTLGDNGAFLIAQALWSPQFGADEDMPGTYRLGTWEHTGQFDYVTDFDNTFVGTSGVYATMEQLIWKEPDVDEQGLGVFSQISAANAPSRFNSVDTQWSVGLLYRGWLPDRDQDTCGLGITNVSFQSGTNATFERQEETAIESFYKIRVNPWATLQPDLQYICNPGGDGTKQDAFLFGVRFQTAL